jgi:hypothetical protein
LEWWHSLQYTDKQGLTPHYFLLFVLLPLFLLYRPVMFYTSATSASFLWVHNRNNKRINNEILWPDLTRTGAPDTYKPTVMTYGRILHKHTTNVESNVVTAQSTAHEPPEDGRKYGPKHVGATSLKCF